MDKAVKEKECKQATIGEGDGEAVLHIYSLKYLGVCLTLMDLRSVGLAAT